MIQEKVTQERPPAKSALEEIEIGYFFSLVPKYLSTLLAILAVGIGLTTGYYLLQKNVYESKIILVPAKSESPSVSGLLGLASLAKEGSGDMDFFFGLLKTAPVVKRLVASRVPDSLGKDSVEVRKALHMDSLGEKVFYNQILSFQKKIKVETKDGGLYQITMEAESRWLSEALLNGLVIAGFTEYYEAQGNRIRSLLGRLEFAIVSADGEREAANKKLVDFKERNYGVEKPYSLAIMNDLVLEYKVKEEKYLLVKKELEMANLELVKSLPPITILEPAESPPWRISPSKKIIFPLGAILSFLIGYFSVLVRDITKNRKQ